jgi:hypothetical protein
VGSEPTAIYKIPCGDRDSASYRFHGFGTHGYSQRSPAGIGIQRPTISVGSEPTAIQKIPCGDRDSASYRFRGFGTYGYSQDPRRGSGQSTVDNSFRALPARFTQVTRVRNAPTEKIQGQNFMRSGRRNVKRPIAPTTKARSLFPIGPS